MLKQNVRHDTPIFRRSGRTVACALALPVVAASLTTGGCGASAPGTLDNVVYLATTGEAPARRTKFTGFAGRDRLSQQAPRFNLRRARPENVPADPYAPKGNGAASNGETRAAVIRRSAAGNRLARLRRVMVAVRQRLSDRDDEVQFQQRMLSLQLKVYFEAVREVLQIAPPSPTGTDGNFVTEADKESEARARYRGGLSPGDPLPANNAAFRTGVKATRGAIAQIRGTMIRMNGILLRLDSNLRAGRILLRRIRAVKAGGSARDRAFQGTMSKSLATSIQRGAKLRIATGAKVGDYVEWVSNQEQGLETLVKAVTQAGGSDRPQRTLPQIFSRQTLIK